MKALIDTNIYSYAMRGDNAAKEVLQTADAILLSPIVIGELMVGFRKGGQEAKNRREFLRLTESPRVQILSITENTAEYFSIAFLQLKRKGTPIPSNDIWIAASALEHGLALATRDGHFQNIDGLLLYGV